VPDKKVAEKAVAFPEAGIPIPANIRPLIAKFDLNGDGTLSREEADQMPSAARAAVMKGVARQQKSKGDK
jgi:hypothetical protein